MIWNSNENWRPKSVFLAFTTTKDSEGKVIIKMSGKDWLGYPCSDLDFQFGKNEKVFMEFRKQIGLVSKILMIQWYYVVIFLVQWVICRKSIRDDKCITLQFWSTVLIIWSLKLKRLIYLISSSSALYDRNPNFHITH